MTSRTPTAASDALPATPSNVGMTIAKHFAGIDDTGFGDWAPTTAANAGISAIANSDAPAPFFITHPPSSGVGGKYGEKLSLETVNTFR